MYRSFCVPILPNHVELKEQKYAGVDCDVLTPEVFSSDKVMLYIYGGCFVGGSRESWRNFCASLAHASSCRVIVPEMRLAPQFPFPAALEDVQSVFKDLYERNPGKIILAGDSSGAAILVAMLLNLKEEFRNVVSHVVLFSPWLDLTLPTTGDGRRRKRSAGEKSDKVLTMEAIMRSAEQYTYESNVSNPLVSPLLSETEKFKGFPPVYIQLGEHELLVEQAERLKKKLITCRVPCDLDIWTDQIYLFQMADEFLADSHLAIEKIGMLIQNDFNEPQHEVKYA